MKFNLKNRAKISCGWGGCGDCIACHYNEWFEGFEAELRAYMEYYGKTKYDLVKEILGE